MRTPPGKCYGKWSMTDPACARCLVWCRTKCEESTKRRLTGEGVMVIEGPEVPELAASEPMPQADYNDYLVKSLEGRFDKKVQWQDGVCVNEFYSANLLMACVYVSSTSGKIRIVSRKHKAPITVKLESMDQVEEMLRDIL